MSAGDLRGAALAALLLLLAGMHSHAAEPPVPGSSTKCTDYACLRCAPDGSKCEECGAEYGIGLDSSGQCIPCNVTGEHGGLCSRCDGNRPDFCLECISLSDSEVVPAGYYATAEGQCAPCPDRNCTHCTSLTGACTACYWGFAAVDGACVPCSDELCESCVGGVDKCTRCADGRYADPESGRCLNCTDPRCADCSEAVDKCGSCMDGFAVDKASGRCATCGLKCIQCNDAGPGRCNRGGCFPGWSAVANGTCVRCPADCHDCASEIQCSYCLPGFVVHKGACRSCGASCQACTFDDQDQPLCKICGEGGLDAATKACVPCKEAHCAGCSWTPPKCLFCDYGYRLTASNSCEPCAMANCTYCSEDAARCEIAAPGYRTTDVGGTEACAVPHCVICESSKDTCDSCAVGFGPDSNTTSCVACPPNCEFCPDSSSVCTGCAMGFYSNDTTLLCEQCQPGDATHFECDPPAWCKDGTCTVE